MRYDWLDAYLLQKKELQKTCRQIESDPLSNRRKDVCRFVSGNSK